MTETRWYLRRDGDRIAMVVEERGGRRGRERGYMGSWSRSAWDRRVALKSALPMMRAMVEKLPPSGDARVVRTYSPVEADG